MKKYVIYNPITAMQEFYETNDEAISAFIDHIIVYIKTQFGDRIYAVVTTNPDGSETWESESGALIENIPVVRVTERLQKALESQNIVKVEVL